MELDFPSTCLLRSSLTTRQLIAVVHTQLAHDANRGHHRTVGHYNPQLCPQVALWYNPLFIHVLDHGLSLHSHS